MDDFFNVSHIDKNHQCTLLIFVGEILNANLQSLGFSGSRGSFTSLSLFVLTLVEGLH